MASPNLQQAREQLGARLRELRRATGLNGKQFAERLGWPPSKVSKIEGGRQTPSSEQLAEWTTVADAPDILPGLRDELATLEGFYSEWRRRLRSGMRSRQGEALATEAKAKRIRGFETHFVPGFFQTAEYARHMLTSMARVHGAADDIDEAVALRMRRQEALYHVGTRFHILVTETVLRSCAAAPAEVMIAQLDRLVAATALGPNVRFGVIPFDVGWPVFLDHGFWIFDDNFVAIETLAAELRLTRPDEVITYGEAHQRLAGIAHYGSAARAVITKALMDLSDPSAETGDH